MIALLQLRVKQLKKSWFFPAMMTMMAIFMTAVFGSSGGEYSLPKIIIVDYDQTEVSQAFIERLNTSQFFSYEYSDDLDESAEKIKTKDAQLVTIIEEGFSTQSNKDHKGMISIISGEDYMVLNQFKSIMQESYQYLAMSKSIADVIVMESSVFDPDFNTSGLEQRIGERLTEKLSSPSIKVETTVQGGSSTKIKKGTLQSLIGFSLFFMTFTSFFTISDVLDEKHQGTFYRIMATSTKAFTYVASYLLYTWALGLVQLLAVLFLGSLMFKVDYGQHVGVILAVYATFSFTMTSIGLYIATVAKTLSAVSVINPIILTSSAMLGGCMWPLEIVNNKIIVFLSYFTPHRYAILPIQTLMLYNTGIGEAIKSILVLLSFGLLFLYLGTKQFKKLVAL